MLSILPRLAGFNPWAILAVVAGLAASHGYVAWKAFDLGGDAAKVECEKRVKKLQDAVDEQNRQIAALNETWEKAISAVQDAYNKDVAEETAKQDELEKRIADYEASIGSDSDCTINRNDLDRVRGKQGSSTYRYFDGHRSPVSTAACRSSEGMRPQAQCGRRTGQDRLG